MKTQMKIQIKAQMASSNMERAARIAQIAGMAGWIRRNSRRAPMISALFLSALFIWTGCGKQHTQPQMPSSEEKELSLTITCYNVGKADAFLLQTSDSGHVTMIDTATDAQSKRIIESLQSKGIDKIDELIITHYDKDHVGGADKLIDAFTVGKIYTSYQVKSSDESEEFFSSMKRKNLANFEVSEEISYTYGDITYTIYPPGSDSYSKDESNNSSLVMKISLGDKSMLFTGDAEKARLKELLDMDKESLDLKSDILKMPHHGKTEDNMKKFIKAVNPTYAVITSSEEEPADEEVTELLKEKSVQVFFTKEGDIEIQLTKDSIQVKQD